eukprot:COSAG01_NODE_45287_length_410_cov_4.485531_1_plen_104_part_01
MGMVINGYGRLYLQVDSTPPIQIQVKGKGKWKVVQLILNGTKLSSGDGRVADITGCDTSVPKSERNGHPYAFRVDLSQKDSCGDKKYIIDPGTEKAQQQWIALL